MICCDEDAVTCDLAETYHIYDYKNLPPSKVAVLACGLSDDSRIKTKLSGSKLPFSRIIQLAILDNLAWIRWSKTKAAHDGGEPPASLLDMFMSDHEDEDVATVYDSVEEFEKARKRILGGEE